MRINSQNGKKAKRNPMTIFYLLWIDVYCTKYKANQKETNTTNQSERAKERKRES